MNIYYITNLIAALIIAELAVLQPGSNGGGRPCDDSATIA